MIVSFYVEEVFLIIAKHHETLWNPFLINTFFLNSVSSNDMTYTNLKKNTFLILAQVLTETKCDQYELEKCDSNQNFNSGK